MKTSKLVLFLLTTGLMFLINCKKTEHNENNSIRDADGNIYTSVTIGNQEWLVENLKATKYNDNTQITLITNDSTWDAYRIPAYCWYDNDEGANKNSYGAMYNWYVVDGASNGGKNVCPRGWHVPSYTEWLNLENYLIANGFNYDGTTSDNKIAKSLAATTDWTLSSMEGVPGNTDYPAYRNKIGFTAFPGGCRDIIFEEFSYKGTDGMWFSTTQDSDFQAYCFGMRNDLNWTYLGIANRNTGLTVRCIKDN